MVEENDKKTTHKQGIMIYMQIIMINKLRNAFWGL